MTRLPLPAIVLLGILLLAPTAAMGFYADDYMHQLVLRGDHEQVPMEPWSLYDFGSREDWRPMDGDVGTFPWWTGDDWKARFFRPVTSVYLMAQHAVWGEWALGYHLVGLLLFGVLLVLIHGFYRALGFSDYAARLGTLLFAVLDSVVLPAGWAANHNSLLAAVFSVASLRLLIRGPGGAGRLVAGLLLAAAAAGSKEAGSVTLALATLVLFRRSFDTTEPNRMTLRGAGVVALLLSVSYAAWILGAGYGTRTVFYATPWADPGRFATNLLVLLTAGPVSLLGPFPLDVVGLFPQTRVPVVILGCLVGIPIWTWIARTVRHKPGVGWLAAWSLGFTVVQAGVIPADRLLFLPAVGALGLLALFFEERREERTTAVRLLFVSATIGSGLFLFIQGVGLSAGSKFLQESVLETDVGSPALGHRDVLVLQTESQFQGFVLHNMWGVLSTDHDLSFWSIQSGPRALRWTRVDERTFDLETLDQPFFTGAFETVFLAHPPAFEVGHTWSTPAFQVEALAVEEGRPTRLRFRMNTSVDAETMRFVRSEGGRLVRIAPPPVGASVELPTPERAGPYMP